MSNFLSRIFKNDQQERGIQAPAAKIAYDDIAYYERQMNRAMGIYSEYNTVTHTCKRIKSEAIARIPFKLVKYEKDGTKTLATKHELYKLLTIAPNNYQTASQFMQALQNVEDEKGNAFAYIRKVNGIPVSLHVLEKDIPTNHDRNTLGVVTYYVPGGKTYDSSELLHFRNGVLKSNTGGMWGVNPQDVLSQSLSVFDQSMNTIDNLLKNSINTSLIFKREAVSLDKNSKETIQQIMDKSVSSYNAGKPIDLPPGVSVDQVKTQTVDPDMVNIQRWVSETVCAVYGIPYSLVNPSTFKYSNMENMLLEFKTQTVVSMCEPKIQELNLKLLTMDDLIDGYTFEADYDVLLDTDTNTRLNKYKVLHSIGVLSSNDIVRLEFDSDDNIQTPPEGEEKMIAGNMLPLRRIVQGTATPAPDQPELKEDDIPIDNKLKEANPFIELLKNKYIKQ